MRWPIVFKLGKPEWDAWNNSKGNFCETLEVMGWKFNTLEEGCPFTDSKLGCWWRWGDSCI